MLLISLPSVFAQGVKDVLDFFTEPYAFFDDHYLYQPMPRFTLWITSDITHTGVRTTSHQEYDFIYADVYGTFDTDMQLKERVYKELGLYIGYGGISLGWGVDVDPDKDSKNSTLSFSWLDSFWGFTTHYSHIRNWAEAHVLTEEMAYGEPEKTDTRMTSIYPADLFEFQLDGYYALNRKRFSYSAVYGGDVVQRRSAGSWMLGFKYLYGRVAFNTQEEALLLLTGGVSRYNSHQLSLGGGYAYNLVAWHRDETDEKMLGLRNLTFNLTLMPMLTVLNPLTISYDDNEIQNKAFGQQGAVTRHSHPALNYTASTGLVLTVNRYSFDVRAHFDNFRFSTGTRTDDLHLLGSPTPSAVMRSTLKGRFFNWGVTGELQIRF